MENKFWRQLLRVTEITNDHVFFVVPGWSFETNIPVSKKEIPAKIMEQVSIGARFFAQVNIGVECVTDIKIKEWEINV
jgi:hypothetical protein